MAGRQGMRDRLASVQRMSDMNCLLSMIVKYVLSCIVCKCCLVLFVSAVFFVYYIYVYQCCEKCSEIECKVTDIQPTLQYLKIVKILQGMLSSRLSSDAFWVFDGIIIRFHVIKTRLKTFSSNEKLMSAGGPPSKYRLSSDDKQYPPRSLADIPP